MIIAVNTTDMLLFNLKCKVNIIFIRKKADYLHEGFAHLGERNDDYSSILAWKTPRTEEPGRLQSKGSQRVGHDWVTEHKVLLTNSNNVKWGWGGGAPGHVKLGRAGRASLRRRHLYGWTYARSVLWAVNSTCKSPGVNWSCVRSGGESELKLGKLGARLSGLAWVGVLFRVWVSPMAQW